MPNGRIICGKLVVTTSQQLYGGGISESKGYMAAFYPSGTGEVNLFEVGTLYETTCSPTGELIAGISPYYNGVVNPILVYDYQGNLTMVPNTSNVDSLDWSPDATKLVYSSSGNLYVIKRDGTGKTQIATSAEAVAWRAGERIAYSFADSESSKVYVINSDGTSKEVIASVGSKPQITQNNRVIYGGYGVQVESVNIDGSDKQVLFSDDTAVSFSKLSFDNSKLCGGIIGDSGIWLINIDGTGKIKIR
ncbi:hypothetical protein A3D23_03215 [candidate division WOR-1 bacterium RIFCSPHIGHO2_02_FULL_53_26]|nr:MAG: hypothetical protein A3D23_03215 [candidate division WOR-1 bacterium RIFCSPHIGHO2_02_FULL_53_26]